MEKFKVVMEIDFSINEDLEVNGSIEDDLEEGNMTIDDVKVQLFDKDGEEIIDDSFNENITKEFIQHLGKKA